VDNRKGRILPRLIQRKRRAHGFLGDSWKMYGITSAVYSSRVRKVGDLVILINEIEQTSDTLQQFFCTNIHE
jgi:hypothetical protein